MRKLDNYNHKLIFIMLFHHNIKQVGQWKRTQEKKSKIRKLGPKIFQYLTRAQYLLYYYNLITNYYTIFFRNLMKHFTIFAGFVLL